MPTVQTFKLRSKELVCSQRTGAKLPVSDESNAFFQRNCVADV